MLSKRITSDLRLMKFEVAHRLVTALLLITVLASGALAQKPAEQLTPNADRLRETVTYLASDALEGRRTGTRGANDAAHYIAGEFQRLGLKPGSPVAHGTRLKGATLARYQQEFPFVSGVELGKAEVLSLRVKNDEAPINLHVGEEWMPLGFSSNARLENLPAVFVNYGITATEPKRDDYAGLDVRGKIVLALTGTPDGDNPHGPFARFEDPRWKAAAAKDKGAKALVLLSREEKFSDERLARLSYDNGGEAGLPVIVLSKPAALNLLKALVLSIFGQGEMKCGQSEKLADGTVVTPCNKAKLIKYPDGRLEAELADGTKAPIGPDGSVTVGKFYGVEKLDKYSWTLGSELTRHEVPATNVIGILEGSDPVLKNEAIVLGAHYDHLGHGGEDSLAPRSGEIHHGADDNASGVAGLLELARLYSSQQPRPKRTLIFIAFSGEEEGLLGSNYYVNHPVLPLTNVAAMINMDMIGRMKDNKLNVGGVGTAQEWPMWVAVNSQVPVTQVINASTGQPIFPKSPNESPRPTQLFQLTLNQDGYGPSDHSSFYSKKVPVLFFFTGSHEDYHKPSDTADKINYADEARVLKMISGIIDTLDLNKRPTFTTAKSDSAGRASGFRVYLGTIPNYADANDGLLLDGVRDDSPAAKAGLQAGDKIVRLAGRDIKNVYDYTYALGEMKAGEEYEVEVMRAGARVKLKLTPAARK